MRIKIFNLPKYLISDFSCLDHMPVEFLKGSSENWLNVKDYEKGQMNILYRNGNWPHILNEDRPKPQYFQKDGKLIILHSGLENQGVYNCYDQNNPSALDLVYIMVATAPLALVDCYVLNTFEYKDTEFVNKHMNVDPGSSMCGMAYFPDGKTKKEFVGYPDAQPNLVWRHQHVPAIAASFVVNLNHPLLAVDSFNLMVYFKWSEWSSCNACLPYR
uniref:Ig-like domain-containing protein n=1 Tax=Romanomermis culicivorax TaxID=13658 RepID=A0A915HW60_ROMCU